MSVKIYGMPISANVIPAVLVAKDLEVGDMVMMNIMEGEHKTEEALKRNPFHQMPSLADGDFNLAESNAILRYIAAKYKPEMYGTTPEQKATTDWALDWCSTSFYKQYQGIWYPVAGFGPMPEDMKKVCDEATENLLKFEKKFLSASKFVGGDTPSIADYKCAVWFWYCDLPAVKEKTGFELSERLQTYVSDFLAACKSKDFLQAAEGFMKSKETAEPGARRNSVMHGS